MTDQIHTIYKRAIAQNLELKDIEKGKILDTISRCLQEITMLESAADPRNAKNALTMDVAKNIAFLLDFSWPWAYDGPKDDRYKDLKRTRGMERERLNYTAVLSRRISESLSTWANDQYIIPTKDIGEIKKMILKYGPAIIYNWTPGENASVEEILNRDGIIIPKENVLIMGDGIKNTNDQIETMSLPDELRQPGKEIGIISHAPHLMRIMYMLNHYKSLPLDMKIRLFPIKTPEEGKEEYAAMEIMWLLYYAYIAKTASLEPYPYTIHWNSLWP